MVTTNQHIELTVLRLKQDQAGYYSLFFARPQNFTFSAGDWMDINFEGRVLRGGITYSLSSSPTEPELRITFRDGVSEFKQALQDAKAGERLTISQYGNDYDFQLKQNRSSVLIAGGVGIAPFRSMLKELYDLDSKAEVQLIYLNQTTDFLFKPELDEWTAALPNVIITYICTKDLNRKKREKMILSMITNPQQNFYISGPPSMVEANEHLLLDTGVQLRNIRIDSFGGY